MGLCIIRTKNSVSKLTPKIFYDLTMVPKLLKNMGQIYWIFCKPDHGSAVE